MPAKYEDYKKAQERAAGIGEEAAGYSMAATDLSGQVMDAVRKDRASRGVSQMAADIGTTLGQIPTDTAGIRQRAGDVVNPMQVDVMTAAQRGQNLATLGTQAYQAEYAQGTLTDILGEHANQLQAMAQGKAYEAQKAQAEAQAVMDELNYKRQQQQDAWNQYVQEQQLAQGWAGLDIKRMKAGEAGGGVVEIPGLGKFSTGVLQGALDVLSGGDIKNISTTKNLRGNVQSAINSLVQNPELAQELFGVDVFNTVRGLVDEASSKLGYISQAQGYLESGEVAGPTTGRWNRLLAGLGLGSEQRQREIKNISYLASEEMYNLGGKTLPSTEIKTLKDLVIDLNQQEIGNIEVAKKMSNKLEDQYIKLIVEDSKTRGIPITYAKAKELLGGFVED
jgi:hypothetical protein